MRYGYLALTAVLLLLSACYGDKGNYDYTEINTVEVEGLETAYERIAYIDDLNLYPQIEGSIAGDKLDGYEFEWMIIPANANEVNDGEGIDYVVGREKDLEMPVTMRAGDYNCYYIVREVASGIEWRKKFTLKVKSITSEGWMILCDVGGKARLDIVFNVDAQNDLIAHDLWKDNGYDTHNPTGIVFNYDLRNRAIIYSCDEGTFNLTGEDLNIDDSYFIKWWFHRPPTDLRVMGSAISQFCDEKNYWIVVDQNNDAYSIDTGEVGSMFGFPINKIGGTEYFKAAPFIGVTYAWNYGHSILMYDATNRQFLEIVDGASYPSVMKFAGTKLFEAKTGRDMVYLESTKGGYNYAILKDPDTDRYWFYCIDMNSSGKNYQKFYGEVKGEGLDRVKQFACHHMNTQPYLFYSTGDKIYQFDMGRPDTPAKEVLSFPGETIEVIKFTPYVAWSAYQPWERERNYELVVGTNVAGGDEESCGIMRRYSVPPLMGELVKVKEHTGLGRIVDITYKERQR